MKNAKTFIAVLSAILIAAMAVGFLLVHGTAPYLAWERLVLDVAALIVAIRVAMIVPKMSDLKSDEVTDALRDLARGHYERRLVYRDFGPLKEIAQAFNELAGTLSDNMDPGLVRIKASKTSNVAVQLEPAH